MIHPFKEYKVTPEQAKKLIAKESYWQHITPPLHEEDVESIFFTFFHDGNIDQIVIYRKYWIYTTSQEYESHGDAEYTRRNPPEEYEVYPNGY